MLKPWLSQRRNLRRSFLAGMAWLWHCRAACSHVAQALPEGALTPRLRSTLQRVLTQSLARFQPALVAHQATWMATLAKELGLCHPQPFTSSYSPCCDARMLSEVMHAAASSQECT